jgi:diguanylate cyclase
MLGNPRELADQIEEGLAAEEFRAHFQPIVRVGSRKIVAAEALVRWYRPGGYGLAPEKLLPVVEEAGLTRRLACRMFDLAVAQHLAWREAGHALGVTVNVAVGDLMDGQLVDHLVNLLMARPVSRGGLTLELTERSVECDLEHLAAVLARLRNLGVRVALDDFGTGHWSLTHLLQLPVDVLKVDRSYVAAMFTDEIAATLLRAILDLAHSLKLVTVVEGVENGAAWSALRVLGADLLQGRAYSGPLPPDKFSKLLTSPVPG